MLYQHTTQLSANNWKQILVLHNSGMIQFFVKVVHDFFVTIDTLLANRMEALLFLAVLVVSFEMQVVTAACPPTSGKLTSLQEDS